ncbi:MAG: hypothetical protein Q8L60_13945 [Gammaproteobacteria bacterium]|nr:hypothetical protein [Gammaproteobacteria bacterium]MDP2142113.1 hypothetical protein [Gammaproteobacteria bacterium]MDP2348279.1 hypothetical protein [Gammaproteobacteria bacterium]
MIRSLLKTAAFLALTSQVIAQNEVILGPVGPSPYDIIPGWHKPFQQPGFAFGGNSGVFAESPNRILIAMRGEARLPEPIPPEYAGYAGSIGINVLRETQLRTWQNCIYALDGDGNIIENWTQWDVLCANSDGPGPHRLRISPYDPEKRVWVINETFHVIYVFSNDGSELLMTLGEKGVSAWDETHFGQPQDVAFLPDGRVLVADGLVNHRVVILNAEGKYIGEFGGHGNAPGQFNGVHSVAAGPNNMIYALDRSGGRINKYRLTDDPAVIEHVDTWSGFSLPLDMIVNEDSLWITDLNPLRFVKLDFNGNRLYSWIVERDGPTGFLEVHAFSVDSELNLYGGDNQYGRSQKMVPKPGVDPALLIKTPWFQR